MRTAGHAARHLPDGYQFGDAGAWRAPHDNAAEQLRRRGCPHEGAAIEDGRRSWVTCRDCGGAWTLEDFQRQEL